MPVSKPQSRLQIMISAIVWYSVLFLHQKFTDFDAKVQQT